MMSRNQMPADVVSKVHKDRFAPPLRAVQEEMEAMQLLPPFLIEEIATSPTDGTEQEDHTTTRSVVPNGCIALVANNNTTAFLVGRRSIAKASNFVAMLLEVDPETLTHMDAPNASLTSVEEDDDRDESERFLPLSGARADPLSVQLFATWLQAHYPEPGVNAWLANQKSACQLATIVRKPQTATFPVPLVSNPDELFNSDPWDAAFFRKHVCPELNMFVHARRVYGLALLCSYLQVNVLMRNCVAFLTLMIRTSVRMSANPAETVRLWFMESDAPESSRRKRDDVKSKREDTASSTTAATAQGTTRSSPEVNKDAAAVSMTDDEPQQETASQTPDASTPFTASQVKDMVDWVEETVRTMQVPNYIKLRDEGRKSTQQAKR